MKRKFFSLLFVSILFVLVVGLKNTVYANSISSINMDIYVDNNGNAEVTEVWTCSTNQGTEVYHPYYNLGNSQITNLRVYDKTKTYTNTGSWNTDMTMNEKAYKCGINKVSDGVEICWGISKYGSNVYTAKYNISNFVSELTDSQMMYWTLIPYDFSNEIGSVKIKIHADNPFSETIDVWGYGKSGALCYIDKNDGAIHMDTEGKSLAASEYMTILAKFPKETFKTQNNLNHDFKYYYNMAEGITSDSDEKQYSILNKLILILSNIIAYTIIFSYGG